MKFLFSMLTVGIFCSCTTTFVLAQRNWLTTQTSRNQLHTYLSSIDSWRVHQRQEVLASIKALPDSVKEGLVKNAGKFLSFDWPNLPATTFLQFNENGNRTNYEKIRGKRRQVLSALVIGELIENKKRFIPQIINGIWAICEESTWAYPAHLSIQREYSALPRPGENIIDLGDASTAELMSWTYLLMKDQLDPVTDILPQRIQYELERRVIGPYLSRNDFWWLGFGNRFVNNWNPTVNRGVLLTALLVESQPPRLDSVVYKTMKSVDVFINQYPEDGGCDEGPGYWSMAGGAMISYLTKLKSATKGKVDITNNALIAKMAAYIYHVNIDQNYFVNFGDAHALVTPNVVSLYEFGEACRNDTLKQFAAWFAKEDGSVFKYLKGAKGSLDRFVDYLYVYPHLEKVTGNLPYAQQSWLNDLQQLTIRSAKGTAKGLFLAAKGGTNGASHNHNDVGNFIIYVDGKPAIIDLGVGTYTRQTFSKDRYKIFSMQSVWHNLPLINDVAEAAGENFKATDVQLSHHGSATSLTMNLASAYPSSANVASWIRTITFKEDRVQLKESYKLRKYEAPSSLSLITACQAEVQNGKVQLKDNTGKTVLTIYFNQKELRPEVVTKKLEDPRFIHVWGEEVYKIRFELLSHKLSGSYGVSFTAG